MLLFVIFVINTFLLGANCAVDIMLYIRDDRIRAGSIAIDAILFVYVAYWTAFYIEKLP